MASNLNETMAGVHPGMDGVRQEHDDCIGDAGMAGVYTVVCHAHGMHAHL